MTLWQAWQRGITGCQGGAGLAVAGGGQYEPPPPPLPLLGHEGGEEGRLLLLRPGA